MLAGMFPGTGHTGHILKDIMYSNILFDLYGTLLDLKSDEESSEVWQKTAFLYTLYGAPYDPEELKREYHRIVRGLLAKSPSDFPDIEIRDVFSGLFREKGAAFNASMMDSVISTFRDVSTVTLSLCPGAAETLRKLKTQCKKICLLSNGQRVFSEMEMKRLGISGFFNRTFFSSDYGISKPDRALFDKVAMAEGLVPSDTVFVGNSLRDDIAGAASMGWDTVYVCRTLQDAESGVTPTHCIQSMDELPEIVNA